jgi:RNA methyltransferase, TrmH family
MITSAQNPRIQHVRALLSRHQEREEAGEFVIEGVRLIEEALSSGWEPHLLLYSDEISSRGMELVYTCRDRGVEVEEVPQKLLKSTADTENPQGILAIFAMRELPLPQIFHFVLVADALRDPGNLGTVLRTAAAAGTQAVLLSPTTADPFAPKVLRAAMGAHFGLPIRRLDWESIARLIKPACKVYVAESREGTPCWQMDLRQATALIVGSEAEGPGPEALALAEASVSIPMPGQFESLNAAIATGILLFEVVRQRKTA